MPRTRPIVAIDGPAGAGKSTVARGVAGELGLPYIDTGAMYRSIAYLALQCGIDLADPKDLTWLAHHTEMEFIGEGDSQMIYVNGSPLDGEIRTPEASQAASKVSVIPGVREALTQKQRKMGEKAGCVMEGRDIGTVVFPDANVKIFLTASPEERIRRRHNDLINKGLKADPEEVRQQVEERDRRDSQRDLAPLTPAPDAILLTTDGKSVEEVIGEIVSLSRPQIKSS